METMGRKKAPPAVVLQRVQGGEREEAPCPGCGTFSTSVKQRLVVARADVCTGRLANRRLVKHLLAAEAPGLQG